MSVSLNILNGTDEAVRQLREAAAAKKCWGCGCLHQSLAAIERAVPSDDRAPELAAAIREARSRLVPVRYDCLGCEVCFPPLAMNALNVEAEACPSEVAEERKGWPPLPGSYSVLRYHAPVAVCTLTDEPLAAAIACQAGPEIAVVGTCQTENLGIERVIHNTLANPIIRFLIVSGTDSRQAIGHLPGQSLVSMAQSGLDEKGRIIGAKGKRPVIRNVSREAVEHFRRSVEVVDMIGNSVASDVIVAAQNCAARDPGPSEPFAQRSSVERVQGYVPERMVSDPNGYFVVYVDRTRRVLSLEHYATTGLLNTIIEGRSAAELYIPAGERNLVSRLDHAAYLGRELALAERSLQTGEPYVQDAAPERSVAPGGETTDSSSCGCGPSCGGTTR